MKRLDVRCFISNKILPLQKIVLNFLGERLVDHGFKYEKNCKDEIVVKRVSKLWHVWHLIYQEPLNIG